MNKLNKKNDKNQTLLPWLVVKFQEEDAVEAIPKSWYKPELKECRWPPSKYNKSKQKDFIKSNKAPEPDWKCYPATVLGSYDTLTQAERKAERARSTSDLSSNNEEFRKKYIRKTSKNRFQSKALSDVESCSDTSSIHSLSDTNEYPSVSALTSVTVPRLTPQILNDTMIHLTPFPGRRLTPIPSQKTRETIMKLPNEEVAHTNKDAEFRKQIFEEIDAMQLKLNDIMENVSLLLIVRCKRFENEPSMPINEVSDIIHSFPVDEKSLNDVERWLESDTEHKKVLVKELSHIGGSTVEGVTRRIMYRVFTNEVGSQYSWEGAKKKKPFKKLAIASTILSTVRLSKTTCDYNEAEMIGHIKAWLVRCKDRMKNAGAKSNNVDVKDRVKDETEMGKKDTPKERGSDHSEMSFTNRSGVSRKDEREVRSGNNTQTKEMDRAHQSATNRSESAKMHERPEQSLPYSDDEVVEDSFEERVKRKSEMGREDKLKQTRSDDSENSIPDRHEVKTKDGSGLRSKNITQIKEMDRVDQSARNRSETARVQERNEKRLPYSGDETVEDSVGEKGRRID